MEKFCSLFFVFAPFSPSFALSLNYLLARVSYAMILNYMYKLFFFDFFLRSLRRRIIFSTVISSFRERLRRNSGEFWSVKYSCREYAGWVGEKLVDNIIKLVFFAGYYLGLLNESCQDMQDMHFKTVKNRIL